MFGFGYEDWIHSDPGTRVAARNSHPDDLKATQTLYRRLLTGESEHETLEKRFIRRDGWDRVSSIGDSAPTSRSNSTCGYY